MKPGVLYPYYYRQRGTPQAFRPPITALQLSDFVRAGRGVIEVLALLGAEVSGGDIYDGPNGEGTVIDPASDLALDRLDITVSRVQWGGTDLVINRSGSDGWSEGFGTGGIYADATVYVQTLGGLVTLPVATALDTVGSGFIRFDVPTGDRAVLDGIDTGDRFIVAIARPAAVADRFVWGTDRFVWGTDEFAWAA